MPRVDTSKCKVCVYHGGNLGAYGFGHGHPFSTRRLEAFWHELRRQGLEHNIERLEPVQAGQDAIERFHSSDYVAFVKARSAAGEGYLDYGDTPAFSGVYEAAATVVGSVLDGVERLMRGRCRRVFVPIAGLHHARRDAASGFCVFNDPGVAIEILRSQYGVQRIVYVDIDAHHGDGVFYAFEDDPQVFIADLHEDGRYLYPGSGTAEETGRGAAQGSKMNIPLPPGADDADFMAAWPRVEQFVRRAEPEIILFQCGADSLNGDPLTHLRYSAHAHAHAAERLAAIADEYCDGRLLAMGGGGYSLDNLAQAWTAVVRALFERTASATD